MNAPDNRSGRRSDRVEGETTPYTEFAGLYASKGPESMGIGRGSGPASAERQAGRVSNRQLDEIDQLLSPRDRLVLDQIDRFRFLSTRHIQYLHFTDHESPATAARLTRRLLYRLAEHRLVEPLERRIGGYRSGSAGYVWRIGPAGDRLLRRAAADPRDRRKEPSERYLLHTLAIADVYCQLVGADRAPDFELVRADPEPSSWHRYLGAGGSAEILKPDLYAVVASGDFEDHWFVEVDRSTESLPVVIKQCTQYEAYRRTGRAQADLGVFPLVLWVVPDEQRATKLREALAGSRLPAELFRVTPAAKFLTAIRHGAAS